MPCNARSQADYCRIVEVVEAMGPDTPWLDIRGNHDNFDVPYPEHGWVQIPTFSIHTHILDVELSTAHRYSPQLYPPDIPEYTDHPLTTDLDTRQQHRNILQMCCVVLDAEH